MFSSRGFHISTQKRKMSKPLSPNPSSDTSDDDESIQSDHLDLSETDKETVNNTTVVEGDYVIVTYDNLYYPGQVIEINAVANDEHIKVSCMQ
ncbi:hypothetical protein JTB14_034491 [Gonioctena quinquepunctata]|nr:hypothetical protein JTB14_034491 [Gonioctena quinquepunctata]